MRLISNIRNMTDGKCIRLFMFRMIIKLNRKILLKGFFKTEYDNKRFQKAFIAF